MTPRYFSALVDGAQRREQLQYETARYNAWLLISSKMPRGRTLSISELGLFSWEDQKKSNAAPFTPEEFAIRLARMEAAEERMKAKKQQKKDGSNSDTERQNSSDI